MSSTLIAHCGGTYRTREDLARIPTPSGTDTWKTVPHSDLVTSLIDDLGRLGIAVTREHYATVGRDGARHFGVMDLRVDGLDTPDLSTSLGLRGSNDRSMAIQVIAAARVFVCDNVAFSGSDGAVVLKKKHTSRLDLITERRLVRAGLEFEAAMQQFEREHPATPAQPFRLFGRLG